MSVGIVRVGAPTGTDHLADFDPTSRRRCATLCGAWMLHDVRLALAGHRLCLSCERLAERVAIVEEERARARARRATRPEPDRRESSR